MSKPLPEDSITVRDQASRRRFIRSGTAFLIAGGALSVGQAVRADECDRARSAGPDEENPKQAGNGSDSDSGAGSDPSGCGRNPDQPKISSTTPNSDVDRPLQVARIKA